MKVQSKATNEIYDVKYDTELDLGYVIYKKDGKIHTNFQRLDTMTRFFDILEDSLIHANFLDSKQTLDSCSVRVNTDLVPLDLSIPSFTPPTFEEKLDKVLAHMKKTLLQKNADYGGSFSEQYQEYGITSSLIRLDDKMRRLKNLKGKEGQVNEKLDDTFLDLAGYSILTLIERGFEE
jgi:hypothetical protein